VGIVTAVLVCLSFVAGCITLVVGYRVGHEEASLIDHLGWGVGTLLLQFAAACVAVIHARAEREATAELERALERATSGVETSDGAGSRPV
jgi:hypothetical protein